MNRGRQRETVGGRGDEEKGVTEEGGVCKQVALPYGGCCVAGAHAKVSTGG